MFACGRVTGRRELRHERSDFYARRHGPADAGGRGRARERFARDDLLARSSLASCPPAVSAASSGSTRPTSRTCLRSTCSGSPSAPVRHYDAERADFRALMFTRSPATLRTALRGPDEARDGRADDEHRPAPTSVLPTSDSPTKPTPPVRGRCLDAQYPVSSFTRRVVSRTHQMVGGSIHGPALTPGLEVSVSWPLSLFVQAVVASRRGARRCVHPDARARFCRTRPRGIEPVGPWRSWRWLGQWV